MSELVIFKGRKAIVQEDAVRLLEETLEMARSGRLQAIAVAGVLDDGGTHTAATQSWCFPAMLGALSILQHRMISNQP